MKTRKGGFFSRLGPGLITGASDDDPSGIGTYSQAGAHFGFGFLWTMVFSYPLMLSIQLICARIGRTTGKGIAANLRAHYPRPVLYAAVLLLFLANTLNVAADLGAMGAAANLVAGGPLLLYTAVIALASLAAQMFIPYCHYVKFLKWLTCALFAYVATAFVVHVPWKEVAVATLLPKLSLAPEYLATLVALLGTTISPYLFFWQASQECEEIAASPSRHPLREAPRQAPAELRRITVDTGVGMALSNLVAFFILLTTAVTLHRSGVTDIETAAQAATALKPIAGSFAFTLFSLGIIGTGLLAVPVLAGSAAYAVGEALHWKVGLELEPARAKGFYGILAACIVLGLLLNFLHVNPIKALLWSAALNGIVAVPILFLLMHIARNRNVMGNFRIPAALMIGGWIASAVMGGVVLLMGWSYWKAP